MTRVPTAPPGGLFDLQVNGFAGVDFQAEDLRAADLARAVKALRSRRTDRILLTLITDRVDRLCAKLERIEGFRRRNPAIARTVVGYHLEGPYLLARRGFRGAHDGRLMGPPRIREFERLWDASGGNLRLMTLAPELPGSPEFIRHLVERGVRVAIGHSDADDRARRCANYANLWAQTAFEKKRRTWPGMGASHAALRFVRGFIFKLGFLDGAVGFDVAWGNAREVWLKYHLLRGMQRSVAGSKP